jgi:DNA-binding transcriptional regulator YiaG
LPNSIKETEYLFKKGVTEFLTDPVFAFCLNIPVSILTGLLSNYFQKLLERKKGNVEAIVINKQNIIIKLVENNQSYHYDGKLCSKESIKELQKKTKITQTEFAKSFEIKSPYSEYPIPIFLEHTPRIVGWCSIYQDEFGLRTEGEIIDKTVRRRIDQGRINGASVAGIAKRTKCSICGLNFIKCDHITGLMYDGKECTNLIIKSDFIEVSLVKKPVNERCLIGLK